MENYLGIHLKYTHIASCKNTEIKNGPLNKNEQHWWNSKFKISHQVLSISWVPHWHLVCFFDQIKVSQVIILKFINDEICYKTGYANTNDAILKFYCQQITYNNVYKRRHSLTVHANITSFKWSKIIAIKIHQCKHHETWKVALHVCSCPLRNFIILTKKCKKLIWKNLKWRSKNKETQ